MRIEDLLGRERGPRWGPRTIDIDLLLYGSEVVNLTTLTVPHPQLLRRPFLISLLTELDPDLTDPRTGVKLRDVMGMWGREEELLVGQTYKGVSC